MRAKLEKCNARCTNEYSKHVWKNEKCVTRHTN